MMGPPLPFWLHPPMRGVYRCLLSLGCNAEQPGPARAAEPANNPLEISGHFVCFKLSLCLSASRARAGELGTAADVCAPPSAPCVGDGGGRGPGGGEGWGHPRAGAQGVGLVGAPGTSPEAAEPFRDARRCPAPSDARLLGHPVALSPVARVWRWQLPN